MISATLMTRGAGTIVHCGIACRRMPQALAITAPIPLFRFRYDLISNGFANFGADRFPFVDIIGNTFPRTNDREGKTCLRQASSGPVM